MSEVGVGEVGEGSRVAVLLVLVNPVRFEDDERLFWVLFFWEEEFWVREVLVFFECVEGRRSVEGLLLFFFLLELFRDGSCLLYTSPSPRDLSTSRMPSSA